MRRHDPTAGRRLRLATATEPDDALDPTLDPTLDPALARAAQRLRADVPVRAAWRDAVLRDVAAAPRPRRARWTSWTRWSPRAAAAAAACLACLAVGIAAGRTMTRADTPLAPLAAVAGDGASRLVSFVIVAPGAARVNLVGDFNAWNAHATPMRPGADGRSWIVALPLAPGRHVYAFVVDGDVVADPSAPRTAGDDFGVPNSVVLVGRPSA